MGANLVDGLVAHGWLVVLGWFAADLDRHGRRFLPPGRRRALGANAVLGFASKKLIRVRECILEALLAPFRPCAIGAVGRVHAMPLFVRPRETEQLVTARLVEDLLSLHGVGHPLLQAIEECLHAPLSFGGPLWLRRVLERHHVHRPMCDLLRRHESVHEHVVRKPLRRHHAWCARRLKPAW